MPMMKRKMAKMRLKRFTSKINNFGHETAWPNVAKMKRKMTKISFRSHEYEAHDSLHA